MAYFMGEYGGYSVVCFTDGENTAVHEDFVAGDYEGVLDICFVVISR